MSTSSGPRSAAALNLQFPQSLAVYDEYTDAQRAVDHLSDNEFPVENCMIVGTELRQVERITGRLTSGKVAGAGALSGAWFGLFIGLIFSLFGEENVFGVIIAAALFGMAFGVIWALIGYAATRGRRDFSSVSTIVATRYEVLVEHKLLGRAQDLLATLPGGRGTANPFA
jgi:hypothetical protein